MNKNLVIATACGLLGYGLYYMEVCKNRKLEKELKIAADMSCWRNYNKVLKEHGKPEISIEEFKKLQND